MKKMHLRRMAREALVSFWVVNGILIAAVSLTGVAIGGVHAPKFTGDPYRVRFKNGAEARIRFVSSGMSDDLPAWNPNGTPTSDGPRKVLVKSMGRVLTEGYGLCLEYTKVPPFPPDLATKPFLPAKLAGLICEGGLSTGTPSATTYFYKIHLPTNLHQADVELSVGSGEFHDYAASQGGPRKFNIQVKTYSQSQRQRVTSPSGTANQVERKIENRQLSFTLPPELTTKQWTLAVYDDAGKPQKVMGVGDMKESPDPKSTKRNGFGWCQTYAGAKLRYVLKARDYQWIKIRNVHLKPN